MAHTQYGPDNPHPFSKIRTEFCYKQPLILEKKIEELNAKVEQIDNK